MAYTDLNGNRRMSKFGKAHFQKAYDFLMKQPAVNYLVEASCLTRAADTMANSKVSNSTEQVPFSTLMNSICDHNWTSKYAAFDFSPSNEDSRSAAIQDVVFLIIGDKFNWTNPDRMAIYSNVVQYMGASKQDGYTVIMVGGDKNKVSLTSLRTYSRRCHHRRH
jgi:hypothetical protein